MDAPDWQRVVATVQVVGAVPDAPDWERIVVGPGAGPIPVASGGATSIYLGGGFLGVTTDPAPVSSSGAHIQGVIGLLAFTPFATGTVNNIYVPVEASSSGFTPNQNFVGIYDMGITTANTFTRLATSAAGVCDTVFNTAGMHKVPLATGAEVTQGGYYAIALLNNGAGGNFFFTQCNTGFTSLINPSGTAWPVRAFTTSTTNIALASSVAFSACSLSFDTWLLYASE